MIELLVSGQTVQLHNDSVESLIAKQKVQAQSVALAINDKVIPRASWGDICLLNGDRVEFFSVVAGG